MWFVWISLDRWPLGRLPEAVGDDSSGDVAEGASDQEERLEAVTASGSGDPF